MNRKQRPGGRRSGLKFLPAGLADAAVGAAAAAKRIDFPLAGGA